MTVAQLHALADLLLTLTNTELKAILLEIDEVRSDNQFTEELVKSILSGGYNGTYAFMKVD